MLVHVLVDELWNADTVGRHAEEVDALALVDPLLAGREDKVALEDEWPWDRVLHADLLGQLTPQRRLLRLTRLDRSARRDPERGAVRAGPAEQKRPAGGVEDERADSAPLARRPVEPVAERGEPAEPLCVRHGRVRRRGR